MASVTSEYLTQASGSCYLQAKRPDLSWEVIGCSDQFEQKVTRLEGWR
ncbi:MAG TPA: hypothetical protein PLG50_05215 [bacterium]|nr:hypothetical protein [bacterium]HQG45036.1 hypothetical protein [bacterium]HQI48223.1 hypothetical protein [bacterium]HQJ65113.1 hypothetical protein [bacterium]